MGTIALVEQAIKPEVLVNRIDFEHFRILESGGEKTKPNQTPAMLRKARRKSKQLPCLQK